MMENFFVEIVVGVLLGGTGAWMMVTKSATPLHSYHHTTTPASDLPKLAWWSGLGLVIAGVGAAVLSLAFGAGAGLLPGWMGEGALQVLGVGMTIAGVVVCVIAVIHYNGGLVS